MMNQRNVSGRKLERLMLEGSPKEIDDGPPSPSRAIDPERMAATESFLAGDSIFRRPRSTTHRLEQRLDR